MGRIKTYKETMISEKVKAEANGAKASHVPFKVELNFDKGDEEWEKRMGFLKERHHLHKGD
jgi:hypothetical protein